MKIPSLRAKRSNPPEIFFNVKFILLDCFVAVLLAMTVAAAYADSTEVGTSTGTTTQKITKRYPKASVVKPSKDPYSSHLDGEASAHYFKKENSASPYKDEEGTRSPYTKDVLTSSSTQPSRIVPKSNFGRPSSSVARNQDLTEVDYQTLESLATNVQNPAMAKQLNALVQNQKQGKQLTLQEYDLLSGMSEKIEDKTVSNQVLQIAEKRKKTIY